MKDPVRLAMLVSLGLAWKENYLAGKRKKGARIPAREWKGRGLVTVTRAR
jgi:hypothetical protein